MLLIATVLIFLPRVFATEGVNSPGYIDVSSSPSGAIAYIDGTYEGSMPTRDISHLVEVTYVGYNDS